MPKKLASDQNKFLRDVFDVSRYDASYRLDIGGWFNNLYYRWWIKRDLQMRISAESELSRPKYLVQSLFSNPILEEEFRRPLFPKRRTNVVHEVSPEEIEYFEKALVNKDEVMARIAERGENLGPNQWDVNDEDESASWLAFFTWFFKDDLKTPLVSIDLNATDEQLRIAFDSWLNWSPLT